MTWPKITKTYFSCHLIQLTSVILRSAQQYQVKSPWRIVKVKLRVKLGQTVCQSVSLNVEPLLRLMVIGVTANTEGKKVGPGERSGRACGGGGLNERSCYSATNRVWTLKYYTLYEKFISHLTQGREYSSVIKINRCELYKIWRSGDRA